MEDDNSYQIPSASDDHVLDMEPQEHQFSSIDEQKKRSSTEIDVCYPYESQTFGQHSTIGLDTLSAYIQKDTEVFKEGKKSEQQMSARLDDLLESNEKLSVSRKHSLYGENIRGSSEVSKYIERYTFYSADLGSLRSCSFKKLLEMRSPDKTENNRTVADLLVDTTSWWIDILAPTNNEMRIISKVFRIHPLTTEDIQAQESREKCEIFQNYMFISFRSFNHDYHSQSYLDIVNFYIIVFKDGLLTFRFQDLPHPDNVRHRIHQLKDFIKVTPEWINYALIDNITDSFAPLIQHTEVEVDSIDDLVLVLNSSEQNDMLNRIGSCRKTVMQLLRLLGPKVDVVKSLIKRYEDKIKEIEYNNMLLKTQLINGGEDPSNEVYLNQEEVKAHHEVTLYLGDVQDHILTMLQNVNHYDLILGRAHRNYLGQISIELSLAGNTTNEVINRLTFFATIVVPLNLVGSLFGMNVQVPGGEKHDLVGFFWIAMGMLLYVVVMVAIGKRTGFL